MMQGNQQVPYKPHCIGIDKVFESEKLTKITVFPSLICCDCFCMTCDVKPDDVEWNALYWNKQFYAYWILSVES